MDKMMTSSERTNQTLDKHVGDSTDSDNEEKEDGELEEGEVEEEFDENPQQKDEAKENNRENNNTNESTNEQNNTSDLNLGGQKFRRRDYPQHHHHLNQTRLSGPGGPQDKRNKHDLRRKRRHSGEDRDDRNRKQYKRGRFRGGPLPDLPEDAEDDEMIGLTWPPRGQNRGQRKQQSDIISNENSESIESTDQQTSLNLPNESKSEQSLNSDETLSPTNDINDDDNMNSDDKQDRGNRPRINRPNQQQQQQQQQIENRGRRYYDNNTNPNNNMNNRRNNDRDRSSWQDRPTSGNMGNNANTNNNPRFRSDTGGGSSTNHGPPLCKFFVENRCMKGNDCLFSHDFKPAKKMEVCKYYVQNKGYCQKNELCPYLHNEFPCKFFHTGTKDCTQGDRCKFSHDPIINEDIRFAFERFLNDSEEMNRQNRGNPNNNNLHHTNNSSSVNFDVMNGPPLPPPLPMPGSLTDPSNFPMIPNLMDLFLLQNGGSKQIPNNTETTATTNTSQSSPPVQRPSLFNDTLSTEKTDTDESTINKTASSTNSTSPSSSSSTTTTTDNISTTTVTTANTTPSITTTTTTNSTCPLPLPPSTITNQAMNLPSPFGRLPPPNLTRPPSSTLLPPPPPPGLFPMNSLGTGRVPILFSNNNGLPLPPPPNQILDINLIAQAAALAAVAKKFTTSTHHHPQSPSPQLGRDIDERDRQSSTTMRGDIDERPSDVYNNRSTTPNLNLLQTSMNVNSSSTPPPPPLQTTTTTTMNDDHLKPKTIQDIFRTQQKPTTVETLTNPSTAGPSFDFISMLEQLKQPKQTQSSNDNAYDSLEIRSSSTQSSPYILRTVIVSFKPYQLPNDPSDPRINKYQEKMSLWSEQERLERFKTTVPSFNNYSLPLRTQPQQTQSTIINDTNSSRDPRLLRNTVSSSKIGVPTMFPTSTTPFVRPNDNIL